MYLPRHFDASAEAAHWLPVLLARDAFVTLVSQRDGVPEASHLPVLGEQGADGRWTLLGHWARANPQWQGIAGQTVLAIVHGPHAYVSPRWYPEPGKAVPTWNYAAAHLYGRIELLPEPDAVLAVVDRLAAHFEASAAQPWSRAAGEPSLAQLGRAIVGFRLHVERAEVKLKLNQHHPADKVQGAVDGLRAEGSAHAAEVADWMARSLAAREG